MELSAHRLLIGVGAGAVALGIGLLQLDSWAKFVIVAGALLTCSAVGWGVGLALKAVPSIMAGDGYEIRDPLVVLSGLGLVFGALVGCSVILGRLTAATE